MSQPLVVSFGADERTVQPGASLTFGREAELKIDSNPYLHRQLGSFQEKSGVWWLTNKGSAIVMELSDRDTPSKLSVGPGATTTIPFARGVLRFQAGQETYELTISAPVANEAPSFSSGDELLESTTMTNRGVPLNREQRLLLVALAEPRLRDRSAPVSELPTNKEVALSLGWSTTKFNRKLDNLCEKFGRLGVPGLKGDLGGLAKGRRERLVDHVLTVRIIDEHDLAILEETLS